VTLSGHGEDAARAFDHDIFVIHAASDEPFVQGYLLPELGLAPNHVLVPSMLRLGRFLLEEIERGVRSSRLTIVVLSSAYMADHWAVFGEQLAAYASVARDNDVHGALLPLWLEDCELPTHIRALVKLDFRDSTPEVWKSEAVRLRRELDQPAAIEPDLPCPYPGMRPFTERDAARFFGRDAELDDLLRRLRRGEREIYVIGASGSGKSSLIAAGLVPMLSRGAPGLPRVVVRMLRTDEQPIARLAEAIEGDLAAPSAAVGQLLARQAPASLLLLVIDQLEELFVVASADQRIAFLAAVRLLRADPRCVLLFCLRADFYGAFMESMLWSDLDGRPSRIELGALRDDGLRMVIERPARDLGVYFQPELVVRLLSDAAREPGALPLLQEALLQLWCKRRHRLLALSDYHALGDGARSGLAFAIAERADAVLRTLTGAQEAIALRILLRLITFGEGRADTRRQQPRAALRSEGEPASDFDTVLQRLVDNRLLTVTGDNRRGEVQVDLAHEILIQAWPTFSTWIRTWRPHEQRRRDLESTASAWRARGGSGGGLLDAVELSLTYVWRAQAAHPLGHSSDLAAFLAASEAAQAGALEQQRRRTRFAFAGITLFVVVTSSLMLAALWQRRSGLEQGNERSRLLVDLSQVYEEIGRQLLVESERPLKALPYLVAAREAVEVSGGTPSTSLQTLFEQATRNLPLSPPFVHHGGVNSAAFSWDGTRVITASDDKTARVWHAATGNALSPPLVHHGGVNSVAFTWDGTRAVTASDDHTARVWDAATGKPLSPSLEHRVSVNSAAFSPDGARVVTASDDKTARVWDAATGKALSPPFVHQGSVNSAAFSCDGTRIVTASSDNTARVWDAALGEPLSPSLVHDDTVWSAAFSADCARVVTASSDNTARVWDAATGTPLSPPLVHDNTVWSAAFSADGARVVTASGDQTARVWDALTGAPVSPPLVHRGVVVRAVFSPDGGRVVTASGDRTARVWDATTGKPLSPYLEHRDSVTNAAFSRDGRRVVTASGDHTARVWDVATGRPPLVHQEYIVSGAFGSAGSLVVIARWNDAKGGWDRPLIPGTLADWRAIAMGASPYVLVNGGLALRSDDL
jgi:WD40 repeat protein